MDPNCHEKLNASDCADSSDAKTTEEKICDSGLDDRLKENTPPKPVESCGSGHVVKVKRSSVPDRIDEVTRNKLKSILNSCIAEGIAKMSDPSDKAQGIQLIVQSFDARLKQNTKPNIKPADVPEDELTLSQCLTEINRLDPDTLSSGAQSVALPLNDSNPVDASSSGTDTLCTGSDEINNRTSREDNDSDKPRPVEIKSEFVDQSNELDKVDSSNAPVTHDVIEDERSNHSPVVTPRRKTSRPCGSAKRSKLNTVDFLKSNRKITDYFSKSKDGTPIFASKTENTESAFILPALKGDPNFCIFCEKNFGSSYLKTHLTEQHGIDKESISCRPIKKENPN